jgi:hypothetical protein
MWLHARTQPPHESPQCRCGYRGSPIILQSSPQRCYSPRSYGLGTVLCSVVFNIAGATESEATPLAVRQTHHPHESPQCHCGVASYCDTGGCHRSCHYRSDNRGVDSYLSTHSNARHSDTSSVEKAGEKVLIVAGGSVYISGIFTGLQRSTLNSSH